LVGKVGSKLVRNNRLINRETTMRNSFETLEYVPYIMVDAGDEIVDDEDDDDDDDENTDDDDDDDDDEDSDEDEEKKDDK